MKDLERMHWIGGLVPAADAFSGTVYTDVFEVLGEGARFLIFAGTNAGGASVVTAQACDDTTPTTTAAVAFQYRACTTLDTWGDWTQATTTGFTTTTGSNYIYEVFVPAAELASQGYGYVRLALVESVNAAVTACVLAGVLNPRYMPQPESLID